MAWSRDASLAAAAAVLGLALLIFWPKGEAPSEPPAPVETPAPAESEPAPADAETEAPPAEESPAPPHESPPEPTPPAPPVDEAGAEFRYDPPGALTEHDTRTSTTVPGFSGTGWQGSAALDRNYVFAPGIIWPMEDRGFPNSQVYRAGGMFGSGGQCAAANYDYPWQDNFCETRGHQNAFCASGTGHQGQDIRPATCTANQAPAHMAVAAVDGYISHIGSISVRLRDPESGRTYWYMHLQHWDSCASPASLTQQQCNSGGVPLICSGNALEVEIGDEVQAGDPIGRVADWFGLAWDSTNNRCIFSATTDHLHFEIHDTMSPDGATAASTRVPPHSSLVMAYLRRLGAPPEHVPAWDEAEG